MNILIKFTLIGLIPNIAMCQDSWSLTLFKKPDHDQLIGAAKITGGAVVAVIALRLGYLGYWHGHEKPKLTAQYLAKRKERSEMSIAQDTLISEIKSLKDQLIALAQNESAQGFSRSIKVTADIDDKYALHRMLERNFITLNSEISNLKQQLSIENPLD